MLANEAGMLPDSYGGGALPDKDWYLAWKGSPPKIKIIYLRVNACMIDQTRGIRNIYMQSCFLREVGG
jgi:hypothetical protein